jgi:excisionase family DNA binding protein
MQSHHPHETNRQAIDLLTPEQTADTLGVTRHTLEVWCSTGRYPELRYVKVGRLVRYRRGDVESFLDGRTYSHTGERSTA